jgi:hypothetical protein
LLDCWARAALHEIFIHDSRGRHARSVRDREDGSQRFIVSLAEGAVLSILTAVIGLVLGFGGLQELVVRGIVYREMQPLLVGAVGALIGALLMLAALAHWRRWRTWPRLAVAAGSMSVAFHLYASMPPERNVGLLAMLLGVGIGLTLIVRATREERAPLASRKR